jgi:hypothetical protein
MTHKRKMTAKKRTKIAKEKQNKNYVKSANEK